MVASFTGKRDIIWDKELMIRLHQKTEELILRGFDTFNTGLCYGSDFMFQRSLIKHKEIHTNIKIVGYVPHSNQSKLWTEENKEMYRELFLKCDKIVQVSDKPYSAELMMQRNIKMVDESSYLLSVFDGEPKGGTWNTIQYALKAKNIKSIYIIKP